MKQCRVLEIITGTKIIINAGKIDGIKYNDNFMIYGLTKMLTDPETGESLGQAEVIRGYGKVTHIQEKLCTIESTTYDKGTSKIIKKTNPVTIFSLGQPPITEEEITSQPKILAFESVQIGDYARKLN